MHGPRGRIIVLRAAYWLCAVFELMAVVPMLSPALFGKIMGISNFQPGSDYTYAMGIAAVFTLGWIALLIWADREPIERRGVALLSVAVFAGNLAFGIYAVASGFVAAATMVPSWIVQVFVIALFVIGHHEAVRIETLTESSAGSTGGVHAPPGSSSFSP